MLSGPEIEGVGLEDCCVGELSDEENKSVRLVENSPPREGLANGCEWLILGSIEESVWLRRRLEINLRVMSSDPPAGNSEEAGSAKFWFEYDLTIGNGSLSRKRGEDFPEAEKELGEVDLETKLLGLRSLDSCNGSESSSRALTSELNNIEAVFCLSLSNGPFREEGCNGGVRGAWCDVESGKAEKVADLNRCFV